MSYGKMNCFASVISRTVSTDAEGFKTEVDTIIADVRCYHEGRHPSYRWANLAAFSSSTDLFVMRKVPGLIIKTGYFIQYQGVRFLVKSVEDVKERGMYYEIFAERVEGSLG